MAKQNTKITLDLPVPAEPFEGFSDKAFSFLAGLKKNNNKPWFEAHRSDYEEYLREPSKQFVLAMAALFEEEELPLVADVKKSLFRINRDIRFSKDKSPYKTHLGIVFGMKDLGEDEWAGMYLGMDPKGSSDVECSVGGGVYMPSPAFLKAIRTRIAKDHKAFEKLNNAKSFRTIFSEGITGSSLKRMPKGFEETHPAATTLKQTEFLYRSKLTKKDLCSPKLPEIVLARTIAAMPMLRYLSGKD